VRLAAFDVLHIRLFSPSPNLTPRPLLSEWTSLDLPCGSWLAIGYMGLGPPLLFALSYAIVRFWPRAGPVFPGGH
jgi:hypothetical protein